MIRAAENFGTVPANLDIERKQRGARDKINIRLNISLRSGWQPRDA